MRAQPSTIYGPGPAVGPAVAIVGIPFDYGVTNRPGSRFGPDAIRDASLMLCDGDHPKHRLDPFNNARMDICDLGNMQMVHSDIEQSIDNIQIQIAHVSSKYRNIVSLGGDHTITLPILRALRKKHGQPLSLLHFDAHVDTWPDCFGAPIGHGSIFRYAVNEGLIEPKRSVQIGIRSPVANEVMTWNMNAGFRVHTAEHVHSHAAGMANLASLIGDYITTEGMGNKQFPTYLTFDIDCIDPSMAPGTGTPEIGGLFTWQIIAILENLRFCNINWVGMDLVEVCPQYDVAQITSLAAATIVWNYLAMLVSPGNYVPKQT